MSDNRPHIEYSPSERFKAMWEPVSFACSLIAYSELHSTFPMSYITRVIYAASRHRFVKFYFDSDGKAIAYVIWAYLAPEVEQRILSAGSWNLHESEWNEGESLWIVDIVAPFGDVHTILADLRDRVFASAPVVTYLRIKKGRAIGKQIERASGSYFFTRGRGGGKRIPRTPVRATQVDQVAVDVSSIGVKDAGSALPIDWHTSGAFMEIYVRGYHDSNGDGIGDLQGLIQKLPYLNELGIKGIWLMPVTNSQDRDFGYAVTDYRAIESDYGTMADFDALIRAAHAHGIGVIMDYVMNHSAYTHPLFTNAKNSTASRFRDWYVWSDTRPVGWSICGRDPWYVNSGAHYFAGFGSQMPDFNFRNDAVINYHHDTLRFWLNRGVDGFRFDAVGNLVANGPTQWESQPENYAIMGNISSLLKQYQGKYMVGEASADPVGFAASTACGSAFAFGHNNDLISAALGDVAAIQAVADYPTRVPATMATFLANHDSIFGRRIFDQVAGDLKAYKLAAATYLLQPGIPFIYYGEEIGMAGCQGQKGDWQIRSPMSWTNNRSTAGFTTGTPFRALSENSATNNVESQLNDASSLYTFYKSMLRLRNGHPALARGSYDFNGAQGTSLSFQRKFGADHVLVLLNYGKTPIVMAVSNLPACATLTTVYPPDTPAPPASGAQGQASLSLAAQSIMVVKINVDSRTLKML